MKSKRYTMWGGFGLIILGLAMFLVFGKYKISENDALGGTANNLATQLHRATTTQIAAKGVARIFADFSATSTMSGCSSRAISAYGGDIVVSFDEPRLTSLNGNLSSTTLSYMRGHQVASSTTAQFDSSLFGCGDLFIYANASTTVTVSEFR